MADTMPQQLLLKKVRDVQYDAVETCDTATSTPKRPGHLINNFKARTELRIMSKLIFIHALRAVSDPDR